MARMPGVPFLGIADNGLMTRHDILTVHTIVGYQSGGNAAHWTTGASGRIVQARDTRYRSAANLNGNWHCLAIENEDHGPAYKWVGGEVPRFTAAQAEAIAKIIVWCYRVHNIPIQLIPDSKVGRRGVSYHRQGIDGNFGSYDYRGRVAGGELWSSAFGKVCPGDLRIKQLITEIIPRARALAGLEDDMTPNDLFNSRVGTNGNTAFDSWNDNPGTFGHYLRGQRQRVDQVEPKLAELSGKVDALTAKVNELLARP